MNINGALARALPPEEVRLREQRAMTLGPSSPRHLRLVADAIEDDDEVSFELAGVDADRLRLLAAKLEADETEIASLRQHAETLHRALCDAIEELDDADNEPVVFVVIPASAPFAPVDALTPEQFSDLAVYVLDEIE